MSNKVLVFVLFIFLASSTAYSGTLMDDFNDGDFRFFGNKYENYLNKSSFDKHLGFLGCW